MPKFVSITLRVKKNESCMIPYAFIFPCHLQCWTLCEAAFYISEFRDFEATLKLRKFRLSEAFRKAVLFLLFTVKPKKMLSWFCRIFFLQACIQKRNRSPLLIFYRSDLAQQNRKLLSFFLADSINHSSSPKLQSLLNF